MGNSNTNSINALHQEPPAEIFQVFRAHQILAIVLPFMRCLLLFHNLALCELQIKVANAGNSCYMDAVLFSMFAMPSPVLDAMLTKR